MAVYFAERPSDGAIKIGWSNLVNHRIKRLSWMQKEELKLVRLVNGGRNVEKWMHERFLDFNIQGEWFRFCPEMMVAYPDDRKCADEPITMGAKIEITLSDAEKAQMQRAADACALKLATWAKARLLLASMLKGGAE